ncbi:MAG: response regulator [Planctomycetota bacterium]
MTSCIRPRILVVDNDPLVVTALGTRLAHQGYFPVPAGTGAQALDVLRFGGIELVITDLHMPVLDGLGLIERIRRNPITADLPVVVVTGAETAVCRQLETTPQLCLVRKPFSFGDLSSICHELLGPTRPARRAA